MAYYLKDLPFTEEGKKLKLSDEDRERFRLVYKREGDGWVLHDIYEKGGEYGDDCIVVPLESTYKGHMELDPGQIFANVKGSTGDKFPVGGGCTWIAFWQCMYLATYHREPPQNCCTDGNVYCHNDIAYNIPQYFSCGGNLCGGHVILNSLSIEPEKGNLVYLVPICNNHNIRNVCYRIEGVYNHNLFMKIGNNLTFAVALPYRANELVQDYLAQRPLETHEKI